MIFVKFNEALYLMNLATELANEGNTATTIRMVTCSDGLMD